MERVTEKAKFDYEALRKARMLENQACVGKTVSELRQQVIKKQQSRKTYQKKVYGLTPLRRSLRISNNLTPPHSQPSRITSTQSQPSKITSTPSRITSTQSQPSKITSTPSRITSTLPTPLLTPKQDKVTLYGEKEEKQRPANAPLVNLSDADLLLSSENSARRCNSKGRGSIYNPVLGICCHFCRQKKLCGEEDCKRCGNFDVNEPCLGKTDCSVCHSSTGVFCRACLKVRYGEEIEEVRENKGWMCPHCIEKQGIKPYWICNSSICLRKRKMPPTGIAVFKAREMGYKSVAHLLMEEQLKQCK
ncbi:hypothetical protein ACSQ67_009272 [Phaseolus vulgaris]